MLSKQEFIKEFFLETAIPVARSMEQALGCFGVSRWVAFHQSKRLHGLCWADGRFNSCRSAPTVWHRFLAHPFVAPYLQMPRDDVSGIETLIFEANDDDPDLFPTLPNGEVDASAISTDSARFLEASRKLAYAILLDRVKRKVYITRWSHAFMFLMFYMGEGTAETDREPLCENQSDGRPFEVRHKTLREDNGEDDGDEESTITRYSKLRIGVTNPFLWTLALKLDSSPGSIADGIMLAVYTSLSFSTASSGSIRKHWKRRNEPWRFAPNAHKPIGWRAKSMAS